MTLIENRPHSHGSAPTGSPAERFTSADPADFAVPTGREEEWRFSPVRKLRALFQPMDDAGAVTTTVTAPEGVRHRVVPISDPAVGRVLAPADRVSAIAYASSQQALVVEVLAGQSLSDPIILSASASGTRSYAHLVIDAGSYSNAVVVVDYTGSGTLAENVEILLADGASLTVISVADWDDDAIHLTAHAAAVGRDATLSHIVVNTGGSVVRVTPTITFAGPGGRAQLAGVSFAGSGQHFESRLYVDHALPQCTSDVVYKSALVGETARTVWIGDVRIRPQAVGTSTYELNRNLLLSDGARADSVPNLEIETGEIAGAGHASATGRFDDLQLFYLQSRGIPEQEARRLVVRGFFAEIIDRIPVPELHDRLMAAIDRRLAAVASEAA
jgi:Fe-S cluster assembly protein SufD